MKNIFLISGLLFLWCHQVNGQSTTKSQSVQLETMGAKLQPNAPNSVGPTELMLKSTAKPSHLGSKATEQKKAGVPHLGTMEAIAAPKAIKNGKVAVNPGGK